MFENARVTSETTANELTISIKWTWVFEDIKALPSCTIFCCAIPENDLLRNSVFTREEIVKWVNNELFDIENPKERITNIEAYYNNPSHKGRCDLTRCQLSNGGSIYAEQRLGFSPNDIDKIFVVCIYDETDFDFHVVSIISDKKIQYKYTHPTMFQNLMSLALKKPSSCRLIIEDSSNRQRALVTYKDGREIYSVLPSGNEFVFDADFNESCIKEIVYLSSLIN